MDDPYQRNAYNDRTQPREPVQGKPYTGGQYQRGAYPGGSYQENAYQESAYQGGGYEDPAAYQEPAYQQGEPPREDSYENAGAGKGIPGWFVVVIVIVALLALCCMCTFVGLAGWMLGGGDLSSLTACAGTMAATVLSL